MIVVDTNVISEPLKPLPNPAVRQWLNRQSASTLFLTTTSLAELLLGIEKLPAGRRKAALADSLQPMLNQWFGPRILPFDQAAATAYANLISRARAAGRTISALDGQIAAVASAHGFAVATRDRSPFLAAGIQVIDPWADPS